jgi:hypothetical protein
VDSVYFYLRPGDLVGDQDLPYPLGGFKLGRSVLFRAVLDDWGPLCEKPFLQLYRQSSPRRGPPRLVVWNVGTDP